MTDVHKLKALAEAAQAERHANIENAKRGMGFPSTVHATALNVAANPAAVLELISQIEGLHAQHGRDSGELRKICSARDSARRQRDQLKAENTDLHATLQAAKGEVERLKAENEALRKDAERYSFIRDNWFYMNQCSKTLSPVPHIAKGVYADSFKSAVDAAMTKDASP